MFVAIKIALAQPRQKVSNAGKRRRYCVYALVDPVDDRVRYVGQTRCALAERLRRHMETPTNHLMRQWIDDLKQSNRAPRIVMLELVSDREWEDAERGWIFWFRQRGTLLNIDPGGEFRTPRGIPRPIRLGAFVPPGYEKTPREIFKNRKRLVRESPAVPVDDLLGPLTPKMWPRIREANARRKAGKVPPVKRGSSIEAVIPDRSRSRYVANMKTGAREAKQKSGPVRHLSREEIEAIYGQKASP